MKLFQRSTQTKEAYGALMSSASISLGDESDFQSGFGGTPVPETGAVSETEPDAVEEGSSLDYLVESGRTFKDKQLSTQHAEDITVLASVQLSSFSCANASLVAAPRAPIRQKSSRSLRRQSSARSLKSSKGAGNSISEEQSSDQRKTEKGTSSKDNSSPPRSQKTSRPLSKQLSARSLKSATTKKPKGVARSKSFDEDHKSIASGSGKGRSRHVAPRTRRSMRRSSIGPGCQGGTPGESGTPTIGGFIESTKAQDEQSVGLGDCVSKSCSTRKSSAEEIYERCQMRVQRRKSIGSEQANEMESKSRRRKPKHRRHEEGVILPEVLNDPSEALAGIDFVGHNSKNKSFVQLDFIPVS
mmetsp:Transcript_5281/g.11170  ORF Transcript_5281/g.11170 Transcript_5281/m.11170 type:complete len:357 (-) Transcript_5281:2223-3293(-)